MQKVLVTGGEGMIGSTITALRVYESWDLKSKRDVRTVLSHDEVYDGIIHLAAKSRVVDGYFEPRETWDVNTLGTINVLEKARIDGSWVINGSSLTADKSRNTYSYSKLATEELCRIYASNYGVNCISIRFSTVYGSLRDLPLRFIPSVARRLNEGAEVMRLEDRAAWLSPTFIEDVANIILDLVDSEKSAWSGQIHSIVGEEGFMSTERMAETMCEVAGVFPKLIWSEKRTWDKRDETQVNNEILTTTSFRNGFNKYYSMLANSTLAEF